MDKIMIFLSIYFFYIPVFVLLPMEIVTMIFSISNIEDFRYNKNKSVVSLFVVTGVLSILWFLSVGIAFSSLDAFFYIVVTILKILLFFVSLSINIEAMKQTKKIKTETCNNQEYVKEPDKAYSDYFNNI